MLTTTAYFLKFGSFDFGKIQRFLDRARQDKLIIIPETDLMRKSLADTTLPSTWIGKLIELNYPDGTDPAALEQELHKVCSRLLVNPNTESYSLALVRTDGHGTETVLAGALR